MVESGSNMTRVPSFSWVSRIGVSGSRLPDIEVAFFVLPSLNDCTSEDADCELTAVIATPFELKDMCQECDSYCPPVLHCEISRKCINGLGTYIVQAYRFLKGL